METPKKENYKKNPHTYGGGGPDPDPTAYYIY